MIHVGINHTTHARRFRDHQKVSDEAVRKDPGIVDHLGIVALLCLGDQVCFSDSQAVEHLRHQCARCVAILDLDQEYRQHFGLLLIWIVFTRFGWRRRRRFYSEIHVAGTLQGLQ